MECYKIAVLYFKCYGHTKYALAVLRLLLNLKMQPQKIAFFLMWERFVNTRGIKGKNISLDLHLEHNNNFLKELLKVLRSNLNEDNADRVSKAMNNIKELVEVTERNMKINASSSSYNKAKLQESIHHLAKELFKKNPFAEDEQDEYENFPEFNSFLLSKLDTTSYLKWANKKQRELETLLEL